MNCECKICKNHIPFKMPDEILTAAKEGKLVLFCGAGISTENKMVLPNSFYNEIQKELNITDNSISFCDLMQKYCLLPNGRRKLLQRIKERFDYIHSYPELEEMATSFHSELSELYFIKTIMTTNWDTYFENYCAAIPITIPDDFAYWDENVRCVLKIHGSINNLSTIIATKDDYEKSSLNLKNGTIGTTMKYLFATKTVIFIGFSFGDDDLSQIINYLQDEMKEIMPHLYIITLDNQLHDKINYKNFTCIVTDGTYFLHQLKLILKEKKLIVNCETMPFINEFLNITKEVHGKISQISIHQYPCVIYCMAYQDGIRHAFERFLQLYKTGYYNAPGQVFKSIKYYETIVKNNKKSKNYWDMAYYEGYLNGLLFIYMCENNIDTFRDIPILYLPNSKCELNSVDMFLEEIKYVSNTEDKYTEYAKLIVHNIKGKDIVVIHPPY